jgi:membrane protein YdbS with pleckstrin-like domain
MTDSEEPQKGQPKRSRILLHLGRVVLGIVELFFLLFGVYLLVLAYHLTDPLSFLMTFFASNLVILISAVLLLGLVLKFRKKKEE